eukprot:TRINITY_DN62926_c0_g1_i1.p1 TRINITY_DN62926_c0_g1~~TRINITY_DN62926_c0_g1_i1.p1  ORF type:complete len:306 (+),score=14.75 TRINITY_DN62926_c0_g1_i1:605-1522(+)
MFKLFYILIFGTIWFSGDDVDISTINDYKSKAEKAFESEDYVSAANYYNILLDSFKVDEDELKLNLAHSYFNADEKDMAIKSYQRVTEANDKYISAKANQHLGAIYSKDKKYEDALKYFKNALRDNPSDPVNQYNYELVKKMLEEKKEEEKKKNNDQQKKDQDKEDKQKQEDQKKKQDQQNKDQQNKDQQKKEDQKQKQDQNKEGEGENKDQKEKQDQNKEGQNKDDQQKKDGEKEQKDQAGDEKKDEKDKREAAKKQQQRLQQIKMSPAKAKMILDAMKNNETKYYQQLKRKSAKKRDRSKPDW